MHNKCMHTVGSRTPRAYPSVQMQCCCNAHGLQLNPFSFAPCRPATTHGSIHAVCPGSHIHSQNNTIPLLYTTTSFLSPSTSAHFCVITYHIPYPDLAARADPPRPAIHMTTSHILGTSGESLVCLVGPLGI